MNKYIRLLAVSGAYVVMMVLLFFLDKINAFRFVSVLFVYLHFDFIDQLFIFLNLLLPVVVVSFTCLTSVYFFIKKRRKFLYLLISSVILSILLTILVKLIFKVERPDFNRVVLEFGYSFPSIHLSMLTALFMSLTIIFSNFSSEKLLSKWQSFILIIIVITCFMRLYLGMNHLPDVVAGILTGIYTSYVCNMSIKILFKNGAQNE